MNEEHKKSWLKKLLWILNSIGVFFGVMILFFAGGCMLLFSIIGGDSSIVGMRENVKNNSILVLKLEGIILEPAEFLEDLNKYIKNDKIKGVLIRINSPGGGTAASQEIYKEILRLKSLYKKPVVMSIGSLGASGAFYISMAGDKIIANEASLLGSIGVIIYLSNLEKLYEWAKIENYVVKTGEFKDSGSHFRPLTNRERDLFQDLIDQFLAHFKEIIVKRRSLSAELVEEFADGRVFSGETALVQGFIDQVGTYYEALNTIGKMTGLGDDPEIFEPIRKVDQWKEFFKSHIQSFFPKVPFYIPSVIFNPHLKGRPLYLMPEPAGL